MKKPFQTLSSRTAWSCPWYRVRQDEIRLPDGQTAVYNVVEKPEAVWIIPVTADGEIVLIRTYRYTVVYCTLLVNDAHLRCTSHLPIFGCLQN